MTGLDFARQLARLASDNRAEDIVILDLRNLSAVADFFVIATGTSDRQMRAIADQVEAHGLTVGQRVYGRSGYENATWLLIDYVDVVLHLFDAERRQYYDLELLWGDAPRIDWQDQTAQPVAIPARKRRRR
ncbi:MAG: ribosome silencing factor [Planctomycetes bacterium]|nr:ribosome silencing factor [Planctomycetota bacterium]